MLHRDTGKSITSAVWSPISHP